MRACICLIVTLSGLAFSGCPQKEKSSTGGEHAATAAKEPVGFLPEKSVFPSVETIQDGSYAPLSRPLFLYVNRAALKRPEAAAFLRYYFSDEGFLVIPETGFISLPAARFKEQRAVLEAAIQAAGGEETKKLNGELIIDGSSTVAPISMAIAEEFAGQHPTVRVPVGTSGTGGGFKKFCSGEIAICDASRHIKESEIELCKKNGIEYLELEICLDGITIVVNPKADWVAGITAEELKKLWSPGSTVSKWSDLNPKYPDAPIKLFGPDTDSGTFEYFTEAICGEKGASRSDYQQSGDDNFLVTGVGGDEYALGYFGYSYYAENQQKLKALAVAP